MKKLVFTLLFFAGLLYHTDIIAINSAATVSPGYVHAGDMTVNQFLSMDLKTFKSAEGKKLNAFRDGFQALYTLLKHRFS